MKEVGERIAKASRAFGALRMPVFRDSNPSLKTKRKQWFLGCSYVYGSETWTTKRKDMRRLEVFHNRCLKGILRITIWQQRSQHLSSVQIAKHFGMEASLKDLITARRLRWLGHVARMEEDRIPKRLLFGWLPQRRPAHGTKTRWRDRVRKDLKRFGIAESIRSWYRVAQERGCWRGKCHAGLEDVTGKRVQENEQRRRRREETGSRQLEDTTAKPFECEICHRHFRRRQDIARHRCVTTRPKGQVTMPPT